MIIYTLLTIALIAGAVIAIAKVAAAIASRGDRLSSADRAELNRLRTLTDRLYDEAADHIALGDSTLAPIVFDEIRKTRKEIS